MGDLYLGFRVEIPSAMVVDKGWLKLYNAKHKLIRVFDLVENGRIVVDRGDGMVVAHGKKLDRQQTSLSSFSILTKINEAASDVERLVKIINVLGNDKIIKERVETFVANKSVLNKIPELEGFVKAFSDIDLFLPNFTKIAWYYAPETKMG